MTTSRQTKYVSAVVDALQKREHATNLELLEEVRESYPEVSATTIHRVTDRLKARGMIGEGPKSANGAERYDITAQSHHHFRCERCDRVCDVPDTVAAGLVISKLKDLSEDCALAGTLTMQGICRRCVTSN